jgi:uncharacterized protein YaiI (UPF0178 family)
MRIIIDGDSQPCKEEIVALAEKYKIEVIIVISVSHFFDNEKIKNAKIVLVDNIKEETDLKILNTVKKDDIVVTCDSGLAYILTGKGIKAISERGYIWNNESMERILFFIHTKMKLLRGKKGKKKRSKGIKPYTADDKKRLLKNLEILIKDACKL